jgi:hypothetical protein
MFMLSEWTVSPVVDRWSTEWMDHKSKSGFFVGYKDSRSDGSYISSLCS